MDHILTIRLYAAAIGIVIGEFLGSFDDLLYALIAFVVADYITGVLKAIAEKNLLSAIGFKGICKKFCIFTLRRYTLSSLPYTLRRRNAPTPQIVPAHSRRS